MHTCIPHSTVFLCLERSPYERHERAAHVSVIPIRFRISALIKQEADGQYEINKNITDAYNNLKVRPDDEG